MAWALGKEASAGLEGPGRRAPDKRRSGGARHLGAHVRPRVRRLGGRVLAPVEVPGPAVAVRPPDAALGGFAIREWQRRGERVSIHRAV